MLQTPIVTVDLAPSGGHVMHIVPVNKPQTPIPDSTL
jgi:hypothetical protein